MWVCAAASSIIDNIPITMILIPIVKYVSQFAHIPLKILGGSLTPIGAPSCIIAVGILRREGEPVSWGEWLSKCLPLVSIQLSLASFYILLLLKA